MAKNYTVLEFKDNEIKIIVGKRKSRAALISTIITHPLSRSLQLQQDHFDATLLASLLRDLFVKHSLHSKNVIVSIVNANMLTRVHVFPQASSKDLMSMVQLYIAETFPVQISDYFLDYALLGKVKGGLLVRINVLNKALVESIYESLILAGLHPIMFSPQSAALEAVLQEAKKINDKPHNKMQPFGLIEIQGNQANLSLFQEGRLVFNRDIQGETTWDDEEFLEKLSLTYVQQFRSLAQRTFVFQEPEYFYLCGTMTDSLKIRSWLEKRLDRPFEVIRTIDTVSYKRYQPVGTMEDLTAAGLLLSVPSKGTNKQHYFDFFYSLKQKTRKKINTSAILRGLIIIAIILGTYYNMHYIQESRASKEALAKEQAITLTANQVHEESQVLSITQAWERTKHYEERLESTLAILSSKPRTDSTLLLRIINDMPGDITLSSVTVTPEQIFLNGTATKRESIAQFEYAVKNIPELSYIFITGITSNNDDTIFTFTLDAQIQAIEENHDA